MNTQIVNITIAVFMIIVVLLFVLGVVYNYYYKRRGTLAKVNNPHHDYHGQHVIVLDRIRKSFFIVKLYLREDARPFLIDKKDLLFK